MARIGKGAADTAPKPPKAAKPVKAATRVVKPRSSGGSFVGLDIGTQTIKAVEVKGSGASLTVTALALTNTPPGMIQGGLVTDPKALGSVIKTLLSKNGMRSGKVVSAAAGTDAVVVRVIEVPKMTPAELAETMKWEIERHIPFAANDVELSYQAIDDPTSLSADANNPNMEVLLAVARRDMVALHLDTLQASGLRPVAIDIEALAVGRSLIDLSKRGLANKNIVIVNIGASVTEVGVFKEGILRFPRTIPLAGDNLTRAIADGMGLTMEAAEDEKRQNAVVLMELLQSSGASDFPFGDDGGYGGASGSAASPFASGPGIAAPPVFGAFNTPAETPAPSFGGMAGLGGTPEPASQDPFAAAANYDPYGNTKPSAPAPGGFDLSEPTEDSAAFPTDLQATATRDDPAYRRQKDIFDAILPVLGELSMELRRSIDYFRSRYPSDTVDQIILCGGSAVIKHLDEYISQEMGVPTVVANPFAGLNVTSKQFSAERLAVAAPSFAVAVGLAARDAVIGA